MAQLETLIDACRAAPDDEAPRLVLADAIGGDRGEFIVVQCALARGGLAPAASALLRRRQRELVAANGVAWSGLAGLAKTCTLRRGFVDSVMIDAEVIASRADAVWKAAPLLRHVALVGLSSLGRTRGPDPIPVLRSALARPELAQLAGLHVDSVGYLVETGREEQPYDFESVNAEALVALRESGVVGGLTSLSLSTNSPDEANAFADQLSHIERFAGLLGMAETIALAAHLPVLRAIHPGSVGTTHELAALPAGLTELHARSLEQTTLAALTGARDATGLERLSMSAILASLDLATFARLTGLRSLQIRPARTDRPQVSDEATLATLRLPGLRELGCANLTADGAFALARALGPQLELLDLLGSAAELHARRDELQRLVAGDVLTGAWQAPHQLSFLGREPREPFWDMPVVELPR